MNDNLQKNTNTSVSETHVEVDQKDHPVIVIVRNVKHRTKQHLKKHGDIGPRWLVTISQLIGLIMAILSPFLAVYLLDSSALSTAQTRYTEEKIGKYIHIAGLLKDGRNPHGRRHEIDTLPVHRDLATMTAWWYKIDDYYQANWLFFDTVTREKYKNLNQLVFNHMDSLEKHPKASVEYLHELKQPLVDTCEGLINWFQHYLDTKYETESHRRLFWESNG
jgi:hypothetical protein